MWAINVSSVHWRAVSLTTIFRRTFSTRSVVRTLSCRFNNMIMDLHMVIFRTKWDSGPQHVHTFSILHRLGLTDIPWIFRSPPLVTSAVFSCAPAPTNLMAFCWTCSSRGSQSWIRDSRCGLMSAEWRGIIIFCQHLSVLLLIQPRMRCWWPCPPCWWLVFNSMPTKTPRVFSAQLLEAGSP